jgi:F0F1-type ATP synthase assembly protein I
MEWYLPIMGMNTETKGLLRTLGMVSTMGISVVVAIVMGVFIGLQLDRWLGTAPWFFYIFLFFGIVAGFRNIYLMAGREIKKDDSHQDE